MRTWQLFALAALIWGTTWHAIVYQLAETTPEFGVALRFALAGAICLAWAAWRGERWRVSAREHGLLAFQGVFMYSVSYLCVYHAERHVPSGLVAVGYSVAPLVNGVISRWIWGTALTGRFVAGGLLGVAGVTMIFWKEFGAIALGGSAALGAAFTVGAVVLSSVGSLASSRNRAVGLPFWPALGWGMLYGAATSFVVLLAMGQSLALPTSAAWWLSLLYLTVAGSVVAFACYLSLQHRLGPGPASMLGVATPVIALTVSTAFEGYRPDALAMMGLVLAVLGNVLALRVGGAATAAGTRRGP